MAKSLTQQRKIDGNRKGDKLQTDMAVSQKKQIKIIIALIEIEISLRT